MNARAGSRANPKSARKAGTSDNAHAVVSLHDDWPDCQVNQKREQQDVDQRTAKLIDKPSP
jgi:hypothetical protein